MKLDFIEMEHDVCLANHQRFSLPACGLLFFSNQTSKRHVLGDNMDIKSINHHGKIS